MTDPATPARQPTLFISHGGGPCFSMEMPGDPFGPLRSYLSGLIATLPQRPRAILMVSAHWITRAPRVSTAGRPDMIYDYNGFPPHTYAIRHDAPGDPALAARALALLTQAGIAAEADPARGFDHGVFVPMMVVDPPAGIPITTLSLCRDFDPAAHLAIGAALAPLRDDNVLIVGSGNSFHNLRTFFDRSDAGSTAFDDWLTAAVTDPAHRDAALARWDEAPGARAAQPEPDHLLPLMVAAGAAAGEPGRRDFHDVMLGKAISGYRFG